jgi:hypothetical protein
VNASYQTAVVQAERIEIDLILLERARRQLEPVESS